MVAPCRLSPQAAAVRTEGSQRVNMVNKANKTSKGKIVGAAALLCTWGCGGNDSLSSRYCDDSMEA